MEIGTLVLTPSIMFESHYYTYGGMQGGMMNDSAYSRERWLNRLGIITTKQSDGTREFPEDNIVAVFFPHNREVLYIKAQDLKTIRVPKKREVVE
jgi:hypothetical protein